MGRIGELIVQDHQELLTSPTKAIVLFASHASDISDLELHERHQLEYELQRELCSLHVVAFAELFSSEAFPVGTNVSPRGPFLLTKGRPTPRSTALSPSPYATVLYPPHVMGPNMSPPKRVFPHWKSGVTPYADVGLTPRVVGDAAMSDSMGATGRTLFLDGTAFPAGVSPKRFSSASFETSVYSWPSEKFAFQRQTVHAIYRHCDSVVTDEAFSRTFIESDELWHRKRLLEQLKYGVTSSYEWVLGGDVPAVREYVAVQQRWILEDADRYGRHLPSHLRHLAKIPQPPLMGDGSPRRRLTLLPTTPNSGGASVVLPVLSVDFNKPSSAENNLPQVPSAPPHDSVALEQHHHVATPPKGPPIRAARTLGSPSSALEAVVSPVRSCISPFAAQEEKVLVLEMLQRGEKRFARPSSGTTARSKQTYVAAM
ncbi:Hypothetical protein, putative [Bodo saltans]|uniref:Uncharacterized protein n=1 Tax=Bodo saltans TaxID=75058 RepID=A0A0S4JKZ1_BODSA|nr:Hypothetical protein, putative [Bodo saltans]|eukprot:CUG89148.1 Hypothetical protein, putative [Bodo saltans]